MDKRAGAFSSDKNRDAEKQEDFRIVSSEGIKKYKAFDKLASDLKDPSIQLARARHSKLLRQQIELVTKKLHYFSAMMSIITVTSSATPLAFFGSASPTLKVMRLIVAFPTA